MSLHKSKKRKANNHLDRDAGLDTSKPSAVFKPTKGRTHTLSIALPGSIIANNILCLSPYQFLQRRMSGYVVSAGFAWEANGFSAVTPEQKTALAGQIARACAVFCVDEVVVFDDGQALRRPPEPDGYTAFADPDFFLYHVLSYLETPPNLRRSLFPMRPDLKLAGALPSLDMPHHLRSDEWCPYREAVTMRQAEDSHGAPGTLLDCGLSDRSFVPVLLEERTRVTVRLPGEGTEGPSTKGPRICEAVAPETPREEAGYYWGYSVRQASSLSSVFTEATFEGGYDVSVGTSERGEPAQSMLSPGTEGYIAPTWSHLLVVFGGVAGLEAAFTIDAELQRAGVTEAKELFDSWINLVPSQGSRTIRTEEAIWIGLTTLKVAVEARNRVE